MDDFVSTGSLPLPVRRRKGHRACTNCKSKKARCVFESPELTSCKRCDELGLSCKVRTTEHRGGYRNVAAGRAKRELERQRVAQLAASHEESNQTRRSWSEHIVFTPNDALAMLADTSEDVMRTNGSTNPMDTRLKDNSTVKKISAQDPWAESQFSKQYEISISEAQIVREGIITVDQVLQFVSLYFSEMSIFYACLYFPSQYRDLSCLAARPALLSVICTLGARASKGPEDKDLHERLWNYTERTVSSLMWNCPNNQVRSLVCAIVLLTEWLPGALLYQSDTVSTKEMAGRAFEKHAKLCWPLLGQAGRLAEYTQLLEHDIGTFVALQFADQLLACRLGLHPMFYHTESIEREDMFTTEALNYLAESLTTRARLDEVKLFNLANRSLYRTRASARRLVTTGQHLSILSMLHRIMEEWKETYSEIVMSPEWRSKVIMFEFCHCQLYIFSLSLMPWQYENMPSQRLTNLEETKRFLDTAIVASIYIVDHEASSDLPLSSAPIEWISRLLHASVFLAKVLLLGAVNITSHCPSTLIGVLRTASCLLEKFPPDSNREYCKHLQAVCHQMEITYKIRSQHHQSEPLKAQSDPDKYSSVSGANDQTFNSQGSDPSQSGVEIEFSAPHATHHDTVRNDNLNDVDWQLLWNADILTGIQDSQPLFQFDFDL